MSMDGSEDFWAMDEANHSPIAALNDAAASPPTAAGQPDLVPLSSFENRVHQLFIGPHGLRALWRLLLYVVLYKTLRFALVALFSFVQAPTIWRMMLLESGSALAVIAPAFLMAAIEGRPIDAYGLPRRGAFGKMFWVGLLWGIAAITVLLFVLHGAGALDFGKLALHGIRILKFAAFWGAFFVLVGLYEEFYTRGYLQFTLTQITGFWPAAILVSLFFGAMHLENPGESWAGIAGASFIGFFFCLTLRRTGTLWFAVGFHASWDWGESFFYSVPDSGGMFPGHLMSASLHGPVWLTGGSVGPEASVFLFVLIGLLWALFDRVYPEVNYGISAQRETTAAA
jgi:uncharacterized protein